MKKIFLTTLLVITCLLLSSCTLLVNKYIEKENGVDITILEEYKEHMLVKDTIPVVHFDYNGVRISINSTNAFVEFVRNDQYKLSDAFGKHLSQYRNDQIIETKVSEREEKKGAKFGSDTLPIDKDTKSLEKIIIVTLDDGTRLSYMFRTFTSGGKVYYAYGYTDNMKINLEMPLMAVNSNNTRKLVLLPLPYDTKYLVGSNIELDSLLKKDIYLDSSSENYYTFSYPKYLRTKSMDKEYLVNTTKEWYTKHCNLHQENDIYVFEYLGVKFSIDFNQEKLNSDTKVVEPAFQIKYIGIL